MAPKKNARVGIYARVITSGKAGGLNAREPLKAV